MSVLRAGVVGDPIAHSLSPLIHTAWIEALGLEAAYERLHVSVEDFPAFVVSQRGGGRLKGVNVTIPHKEAALAAADVQDAAAAGAGAANLLLFRPDGRVEARNTDGIGLLDALRAQAPGFDPAAAPVLVLGAGGAARGAAAALVRAGCPQVRLINRTRARADAIADLFPGRVRVFDATTREGDHEAAAALAGAGAVINATSLGLSGGDGPRVPWGVAAPDTVAMDMVYKPLRTPFLRAAARAGLRTVDGLEMLVRQAAPSFEAFFGAAPPLDRVDVRALALKALGEAA